MDYSEEERKELVVLLNHVTDIITQRHLVFLAKTELELARDAQLAKTKLLLETKDKNSVYAMVLCEVLEFLLDEELALEALNGQRQSPTESLALDQDCTSNQKRKTQVRNVALKLYEDYTSIFPPYLLPIDAPEEALEILQGALDGDLPSIKELYALFDDLEDHEASQYWQDVYAKTLAASEAADPPVVQEAEPPAVVDSGGILDRGVDRLERYLPSLATRLLRYSLLKSKPLIRYSTKQSMHALEFFKVVVEGATTTLYANTPGPVLNLIQVCSDSIQGFFHESKAALTPLVPSFIVHLGSTSSYEISLDPNSTSGTIVKKDAQGNQSIASNVPFVSVIVRKLQEVVDGLRQSGNS
ncbi:hypothetical protein HDV03_002214 [Kappamyces sp. JEL0829]|nr:hypothetical protein HDV03_002214 [Kappamyces sp. JEL0829]